MFGIQNSFIYRLWEKDEFLQEVLKMRIFFFHLQKKAECFVSMLMVPRGIEMLPSISCFRRQVLVTYNGISSIVLNRKGLGELVSCRLFPCGGCLQNTPCVSSSRT